MKVFLSWSGDLSREVAIILREWIPNVIQAVEPYVSSEDIDKGTRWGSDIATELEESSFGILCITQSNKAAPWVLFEAGALSKKLSSSFVCPFLFKVKNSDIKGPLTQFQSTTYREDDVFKLIKSINSVCGDSKLDETRLKNVFSRWWPDLQERLDLLTDEGEDVEKLNQLEKSKSPKENEILEQILESTRNTLNLLRSPESIFPLEYMDYISRENRRVRQISPTAIRELEIGLNKLTSLVNYINVKGDSDFNVDMVLSDIIEVSKNIIRPARYVISELGVGYGVNEEKLKLRKAP